MINELMTNDIIWLKKYNKLVYPDILYNTSTKTIYKIVNNNILKYNINYKNINLLNNKDDNIYIFNFENLEIYDKYSEYRKTRIYINNDIFKKYMYNTVIKNDKGESLILNIDTNLIMFHKLYINKNNIRRVKYNNLEHNIIYYIIDYSIIYTNNKSYKIKFTLLNIETKKINILLITKLLNKKNLSIIKYKFVLNYSLNKHYKFKSQIKINDNLLNKLPLNFNIFNNKFIKLTNNNNKILILDFRYNNLSFETEKQTIFKILKYDLIKYYNQFNSLKFKIYFTAGYLKIKKHKSIYQIIININKKKYKFLYS